LGHLIDHKQEHLLADINDLGEKEIAPFLEKLDRIDYPLMDMVHLSLRDNE